MFNDDLERGKRGEMLAMKALEKEGFTVEDVSYNKEYQRIDIDFIITRRQRATVEVKNDARSEETGNMFVETYNNNNSSHAYLGWYYYTEADFILFLQERSGKAHIIHYDDLRELIKKNNYRIASCANADGYLVPLTDIKRQKSYLCLEVG